MVRAARKQSREFDWIEQAVVSSNLII
uniref:Uncharacterized protein n=1 Tax=Arundo donax TaxID=35708 RepID=A0A0A8Y4L1_ARUDO